MSWNISKVALNFWGFIIKSLSKGCQIDNSCQACQRRRLFKLDSLFRGVWLQFSLEVKDPRFRAWQLVVQSLEHLPSFLPNNLSG